MDKVATEGVSLCRTLHFSSLTSLYRFMKKSKMNTVALNHQLLDVCAIYGQPDLTQDIIRIIVMTFNAS